jgi:hypothetical protein
MSNEEEAPPLPDKENGGAVRPSRASLNATSFPLPELGEGEAWIFPVARNRVNLTRDHSSAAENGVKAAFPNSEVFSAECTFHAGPSYWSKAHIELFKCTKAQRTFKKKELNADFEKLKNCPHANIVQILKEEMVLHWKESRGRDEEALADAWATTYMESNLSRVLLVEHYALRGGMPADNNIAERSNRDDKELRKYRKKPPVQFIAETEVHLKGESQTDRDFYGKMKNKINSGEFVRYGLNTLKAENDQLPCLLNLQFPITAVAQGVPVGSMLVPKYRTIRALQREHGASITVEVCKEKLNPRNLPTSPLGSYRWLVRNPRRWLEQRKVDMGISYKPHMGFGLICACLSKFCCLRPIDASKEFEAVHCFRTILNNNGYTILQTEEIAVLGTAGLVA